LFSLGFLVLGSSPRGGATPARVSRHLVLEPFFMRKV